MGSQKIPYCIPAARGLLTIEAARNQNQNLPLPKTKAVEGKFQNLPMYKTACNQ